ncbi:glycosyltransferase family 4 protein [Desulfoluna spongiiphila]|uniref:glycosyltransferase family 4 protein n=1 Tax=Desulfoluna spongiiphila TaxID=419481 RepID=UPI0012565D16|nr:glycosyltransferase family 4 protein [Desulfoluna spongiiphila]VVS94073.1 glycosyl transferase family 1 [Desulfoluna spongiiphila]
MEGRNDRKKLVFIVPRPFSKVSELSKYEDLSVHYQGVILSSCYGHMLKVNKVGNFRVIFTKIRYDHYLMYNMLFFLRCVAFALAARVKRDRYDLVVTYDPLKTGVWGAITAGILNAKFAPEVNGVYTSPAEYLDDAETLSVKLKKFFYPRIEAWVLKRADGVKLLFPTQVDPFKPVMKTSVIHSFSNYVPIDRFAGGNGAENHEILFVGYPFKRKGVDILIHAFKQVAPDFPQWRLKILGWYPDRRELEACMGNHPQISHHPPVETSEVPEHIKQCSIFVLPSRSEAMGRVLVESMAAGKPRIGAHVDGIPTVIRDGVDGVLFEPENTSELSEKLSQLMADKALRESLGDAARKRAFSEHVKEIYLNNVVTFYNATM